MRTLWPKQSNRLIDGYDAVDLDILWQIILHDLPLLVAELEEDAP